MAFSLPFVSKERCKLFTSVHSKIPSNEVRITRAFLNVIPPEYKRIIILFSHKSTMLQLLLSLPLTVCVCVCVKLNDL